MKKIVLAMISMLFLATILPHASLAVSAQTEDNPHNMNIISETDNTLVYTIYDEVDEKTYKYEEITQGNTVSTLVYEVNGDKETLVEDFDTTISLMKDTITVETYDKIKNTREIVKGSLSDPENGYIEPGLPGNDVEGPQPMSYNTWVKSCCTTMSYYMKNNGGGKARYSTMEKRPASYNQHFNTYSKQVDALKSLEYGTLIGLIGVGSIKKAVKLVKNPTLANVKNFLKELFLPIAAAIALFNWIKAYDKAVKSWLNIPGTKYKV